MSTFGENLRAHRKSLGLSQKEFGSMVGLRQTTIANYENDRRFPKGASLIKLANSLNVDITSLMDDRGSTDLVYHDLEKFQYDFMDAILKWDENRAYQVIRTLKPTTSHIFELYETMIRTTLYEVGDLWANGQMSVMHEHYASEICKKAMIMLSNQLEAARVQVKTAVCMTVNPEEHNIGVQMIGEALRQNGIKTHFIGSSIPTDSLVKELVDLKVDYLAVSVTMTKHLDNLSNLIKVIRADHRLKSLIIIVGGRAFTDVPDAVRDVGGDVYIKNTIEMTEWIESIEKKT